MLNVLLFYNTDDILPKMAINGTLVRAKSVNNSKWSNGY
jgi:hypothetical protein